MPGVLFTPHFPDSESFELHRGRVVTLFIFWKPSESRSQQTSNALSKPRSRNRAELNR
jgi:hypothetical protein